MPVETVTISLPPETAALVHEAVERGEFASSLEVLEEALHLWADARTLHPEDVPRLRRLWEEAQQDQSPGVDPDEVFDRLERRYQVLVDRQVEPESAA